MKKTRSLKGDPVMMDKTRILLRPEKAIQFGRDFEKKFFGAAGDSNDLLPGYMERSAAIESVFGRQQEIRWDPSRPKTKFAKEAFECVQSYLPSEFKDKLQLLCAIGTCLDVHHGCDCFFAIEKVVVTIDLSRNDKQKNELKADINLSENGWTFDHMWRRCQKIAHLLMARLSDPSRK